ncbi:MAG: hypothetical protein AAF514_02875 [Verrucomicrobiota bacterium]
MIWKGRGFLWPVAALAGPVVLHLILKALDYDLRQSEHQKWGVPLFYWSAFISARWFTSRLAKSDRDSWSNHRLLMVPAGFYTAVLGLFCVAITYFAISGHQSLEAVSRLANQPRTLLDSGVAVVGQQVGKVVDQEPLQIGGSEPSSLWEKTEWTNEDGRVMTATFLETIGQPPQKARFLKSNHKVYTFPLARLSRKDREFILAEEQKLPDVYFTDR